MSTSEKFLKLRIGFNKFFGIGSYISTGRNRNDPTLVPTLVCMNTLPPVHVHVHVQSFQAGNPWRFPHMQATLAKLPGTEHIPAYQSPGEPQAQLGFFPYSEPLIFYNFQQFFTFSE